MRTKRSYTESKGLASILALGFLAILTLFASGFVLGVNDTITGSTAAERRLRCLYTAESGAERAIAVLQTNPAFTGEKNTALDDMRFTVSVESAGGVYHIVSVAHPERDPARRCRIDADVRIAATGPTTILRWEEVKRW